MQWCKHGEGLAAKLVTRYEAALLALNRAHRDRLRVDLGAHLESERLEARHPDDGDDADDDDVLDHARSPLVASHRGESATGALAVIEWVSRLTQHDRLSQQEVCAVSGASPFRVKPQYFAEALGRAGLTRWIGD
jgi:hypothetical protein